MTEHLHVHPKWRWLQLVAWIFLVFFVAGAFAVQGGNIDRDNRTQHDVCVGIVKNLDGIIEVAQVEVREGDFVESDRGRAAHVLLQEEIEKLQQSRKDLLDSNLCNGVNKKELTSL